MSGPELGHRVEEQLKRSVARYRTPSFGVAAGAEPLPVIPGLRDGLGHLVADGAFRDMLRDVVRAAESGRFRLLGVEWPGTETGPARWHLDPTTGQSWPSGDYCFSIPYRHAPGMGDIKYVWELNRLPHVQAMAALSVLDGDDALAGRCAAEIESWIDANPPFRGVNWASGIELALRSLSILVATSLLGDKAFTQDQRRKILGTLAAHGYWLNRYPSRFSSANNHLIAEAAGLYLLGTLAPALPGAAGWAAYGRRTLVEEAARQIHDDGVGAEQSPTYTAFTLEWLLLCGTVARCLGQEFPAGYWQRIALAGEYLRWVTDRNGHQPRIGDDDEGRVFSLANHETRHVASIMSALSHAAGRAELAPPAVDAHLRDALFGPARRAEPPQGFKCFKSGGYSVSRTGSGAGESLLVFDHGPLGYLSIAAHGHADALAVWLHVGGEPVLADAGTYLYHAGGADRDHFRGTSAHNTLSVDGADSSRIAGAFNWSEKAATTLLTVEEDPAAWSVEAEHDGFARAFGVRHRRRLARVGEAAFSIEDTILGDGAPCPVEIGFLAHPDITVTGQGKVWTFSRAGRPVLTIAHQGDLSGVLQRGEAAPHRGWHSERFGTKVPTSRLAFIGNAAKNSRYFFRLTVMAED